MAKESTNGKIDLRIIDFNASFDYSEKAETNCMSEVTGFIPYRAPEVSKNNWVCYSKSVDIWALGCIAFKLDTGFAPFGEEPSLKTLEKIESLNFDINAV